MIRKCLFGVLILLFAFARADRTSVVFIHGANVSPQDERVWAAEIYKRLWQAGADMEFYPVSWESDIGPSYNYQVNVSNAVADISVFATNTVFNPSPASITNAAATRLQTDYHLAQGIPALSPPTGRTRFSPDVMPSFDLNDPAFMTTDWPRPKDGELGGRFLHSDIKDVAYFYVHRVFEQIVEIGGLK